MRSVVVTGVETITAAGCGVAALWDAVVAGRSHGAPVTAFDVSRNASRIAAAIPDFDPLALGLSREFVERSDRSTHLAVAAARRAFASCGLADRGFDPRRVGVCIGTAIGGVEFMEREFRRACVPQPSKPEWVTVQASLDPATYGAFLALSVSSEVARDLDVHGPVTTMATGCTAGVDALGTAMSFIRSGRAEVMVSGGVDASLTPIVLTSFDQIKALTRRNDDAARASRPFDRDRDGFLLAEGCGVLVLEEEEHARRTRAPVLGRLLGFASLSNAYHMTGLHEGGEALASTIECALRDARVDRGRVGYINAHGSSTQQNDRNESAAFKRVFDGAAYRIPISSTKSIVGHSLGAASAIEAIVCLLALEQSVVPPTANYETPCPHCDLDYVPNTARELRFDVAECNASGFSGIHSSLILGREDFSTA